jgi:hypothetical protein
MAIRRIFSGFCINLFGLGPLHYVSKFSEIFVIEKRLPDSPSRGVDKITYRYNFFPWHLFCQIDLLKGCFSRLK